MALEDKKLLVVLDGALIGAVEQKRGGDIILSYDGSWQESPDAYPLSLSLPLALERHPDKVVRPFLEGLLPDNENVLKKWGKEFHVSQRNPFALLTHMGEDCAGAVQLVAPNRLSAVLASDEDSIDWLTEADIGERLRDAIWRHGTGRLAGDNGHFSLAGAQPKTALFLDGSQWGIPNGAVPTTHILKPPAQEDLDGFHINEHFCLRLAAELGLAAAKSSIETFDGEPAIVVERCDRNLTDDGRVVRLHQEDACQSLGIPPWRKYENEGGPGAADIVKLLLRESSDAPTDVGAFIDALALNWAIGGTDAHAKNYSILLSQTEVRLAPLYDLISALPYPKTLAVRKLKLAMRVGGEYHVWKVRGRHWKDLATKCDLDPGPLVQRVADLIGAVHAATQATASHFRREGAAEDIVDRLEEAIVAHASDCLAAL
jgi:serine/threonine-protein kinase HipA